MPLSKDHTRLIRRIKQLEAPQRVTHLDRQTVCQACRETHDRLYSQKIIQVCKPDERPSAKQRLIGIRISPTL
jgi:NMD protein affecting ribosome stability and mRNA decay